MRMLFYGVTGMTWYFAMFLGLVQGLTEFLPVSSSGHLVILQQFFGMQDVEQSYMLFDALLHFGTLIAVCAAFWPDIRDMVLALFNRVPEPSAGGRGGLTNRSARRLLLLLIIATLPLIAVAFFQDAVEALFKSTVFTGCALMVTGLVIYLSDRAAKGSKAEKSATAADALFVGAAQMLAVVPGLSRSGMTISAGLSRRFDRSFAVKFSFLLSIPAILGANLLSVSGALKTGLDVSLLPVYAAGVVTAAVSGYYAIRFMRRLAKKGKFGGFAWYCLAVGAVTVILSLSGVGA